MALNPMYCARIILTPNTSPFGSEYTEEGIRKSVKEAEAILEDHTLQRKYIEFDLSFMPTGIPKQCKRPRRHKGWLMVSDKSDAASKPRPLGDSE